MLHHFVARYRDEIAAETKALLAARECPHGLALDFEHGVQTFLTQLSDTLAVEGSGAHASTPIGLSAARHAGEMVAVGFTLSQVVHEYGAIRHAVTKVAFEHHASVTTEEFHILHCCLDTAIAEAVTEYARITTDTCEAQETERLGQLGHELRNFVQTALLAYDILKGGTVPVDGSTGAVLGRVLVGLSHLVGSTLANVRVAANQQRRERVGIPSFLDDIAAAGRLLAEHRGQHFAVDPIDPELAVDVDPQLLASALTNLLNNACKFTRPGGRIRLAAHRHDVRVRIEVEDECGGLPEPPMNLFEPFGDRRGTNRTGLGLGLAIARRAVKAQGGDITIRNVPRRGCVFTIDVPLAAAVLNAPKREADSAGVVR
jgi:signal transduction histidine kinase